MEITLLALALNRAENFKKNLAVVASDFDGSTGGGYRSKK